MLTEAHFAISSERFDENWDSELSFFDRADLFSKIGSGLRLKGPEFVAKIKTIDDAEDALERIFCELLERGAIVPLKPLSDEAATRLEALRRAHRYDEVLEDLAGNNYEPPVRQVVPTPEPVDDFADIIRDQQNLSVKDLKVKLLDKNYARRYELWAQADTAKREAEAKADLKARGWR
jgi:hypothetical protein